MLVSDITKKIKEIKIKNEAREYEVAWCMKDDLWEDVFKEIAAGSKISKELAEEVLKIADIGF